MVDLDWGNCTEHLSDIMSNPVASKLFSNNSILCLGADFVPLPKGKRVRPTQYIAQAKALTTLVPAQTTSETEKGKEASRTVPRIILAMGAKRVEAVAEIRFASDQSCKVFDYVVVKDKGEVVDDLPNDAITLVHLPWVKECLIAGRLLEAPQW
jgi:hypothetical protein